MYAKKLELFFFFPPKNLIIGNFWNVESFTSPSYRELNAIKLHTGKILNIKWSGQLLKNIQ